MASVGASNLSSLCSLLRVPSRTRYWLVVLLYFAISSSCTGEIICKCTNSSCKLDAELTLSRQVFKSGSNLTASCTLVGAFGQHCNFTARDIFFKYLGQRIDPEFVTVTNRTTATLNLPGVKRADSGAHIYCFVDGYVNRMMNGHQLPMNVGQAVISIADHPEQPRFTGCTVYNWLSMTCTWQPATQDTGIKTEQTLYWTVLKSEGYFLCPVATATSCSWQHSYNPVQDSFMPDLIYYLWLESSNDYGSTSYFSAINTHDIVKPDAVKKGNVTSESRSIHLMWYSPVPHFLPQYTLLYNLQVLKMNSHNGKIFINVTTSNMTVNYIVGDLKPNTEYQINIKCIPYIDGESKGFWSNSTMISIMTKPDVPGAVPKVTSGGFRLTHEDKKDIRQVQIFWQNVPPEAVHGNNLVTRLRVFEIQNTDNASCTMSDPVVVKAMSDTNNAELTLHKQKAYAVCIDVRNEVGFNKSAVVQPVIIPHAKEDPVVVDFHAQGRGNEIMLKWMPLDTALSYTVYWCPGSVSYLCNTKHQLAWQLYPNTTLSAQLMFPDHVTYQSQVVAMSAEYTANDGSFQTTGMHVADCIFSVDKEPVLPDHIEVPSNQYLPQSLIVKWRKPKCDMTGYIKHFLLVYCKEKRCSQTETAIEVPIEHHLNGDMQEYIIPNMEEDVNYLIKLASVGDNATSPFCVPIRGYVLTQGLTLSNKIIICVASLTGFLLLMAGTCYMALYLYRRFNRKIIISLPQDTILTTGLDPDGSHYYTGEVDRQLTDDCEISDNIRTGTFQFESQSLLNSDENPSNHHYLTDKNSISLYNKVSSRLPAELDHYIESERMQGLDYVDDIFSTSEPSEKDVTANTPRVLSCSDIRSSSLTSLLEEKEEPTRKSAVSSVITSPSSSLITNESESTATVVAAEINTRQLKNDSTLDIASPEPVIHWGHNVGKLRIQKGKELVASAPSSSSSSSSAAAALSSSTSGPCINGHLSLDTPNYDLSSSNSDSIICASSGVASDCSSSSVPEMVPVNSAPEEYVVNGTDLAGSRPSAMKDAAAAAEAAPAAVHSQVKNKEIPEALPKSLQVIGDPVGYSCPAAEQQNMLPNHANEKEPFELLPLGYTDKLWQRDSGISTESAPCSSDIRPAMGLVDDPGYVDHNNW